MTVKVITRHPIPELDILTRVEWSGGTTKAELGHPNQTLD